MKTLLALAALVATALPAAAQQTRTVKLRAICFQHVGDIRKVSAVSGGEKPTAVEFELFTSSISDEVEAVVTGDKLTFAVQGTGPDGKAALRTVATARAVPGPRQLAIFVPGEPNGMPYRCFVIDDSVQKFPMGSTTAVNLSSVPFRFSIGEHVKDLIPGKIETIPMARKTNDRGQVSVIISVADAAAEGGWKAVSQTRWFTGTDKRDLAIAYIHPKTKQPTVNCYADTPVAGR